jgi:hypothetical protein
MIEAGSMSQIPAQPAVYAIMGGDAPRSWVAYVGHGGDLRERLTQHFIRRDSSVVTGTQAVGLSVEHVRAVRWWEHPSFGDKAARHAAELVAFDVLDPALRSRGNPSSAALALYTDDKFKSDMIEVFQGPPAGQLLLPNLQDVARRLEELERRLAALEAASTGR